MFIWQTRHMSVMFDLCLYVFFRLVFLADVYMTDTTYVCHVGLVSVFFSWFCFLSGCVCDRHDIRLSWLTNVRQKTKSVINGTTQVSHTWHVSRHVDTRHLFFLMTPWLAARIKFFASYERFVVYARVFITHIFQNVWTRARFLPLLSTLS